MDDAYRKLYELKAPHTRSGGELQNFQKFVPDLPQNFTREKKPKDLTIFAIKKQKDMPIAGFVNRICFKDRKRA